MNVTLSAAEGAVFLAPFDLPLVEQHLAASPAEALEAGRRHRDGVVLKLQAHGLSHKSDAGGVKVGLRDSREITEAASELLDLGRTLGDPSPRVLVQPMVRGVAELIVGISNDPTFGPILALGAGGVLAELLEDVTFAVPPLTRDVAREMLGGLRTFALLQGFRGRPVGDIEAVVDVILKVSRIAEGGSLKELDLNPVIVRERGAGCVIVDNRVVIAQSCDGDCGKSQ